MPNDLDPGFLMWDMRRMLQPIGLADDRTVIEFQSTATPAGRSRYWLGMDDTIDPCLVDSRQRSDLSSDDREMPEILGRNHSSLSSMSAEPPVLATTSPSIRADQNPAPAT